jgi:hypothetical protein
MRSLSGKIRKKTQSVLIVTRIEVIVKCVSGSGLCCGVFALDSLSPWL